MSWRDFAKPRWRHCAPSFPVRTTSTVPLLAGGRRRIRGSASSFGTTNAESGYLRDTTGNRRFWPVKTPGGGVKHSWELTNEDISQIWAEVVVLVENGEKLHLAPDLETLAKSEQREALESDEREGLVREYLETLLPEIGTAWICSTAAPSSPE